MLLRLHVETNLPERGSFLNGKDLCGSGFVYSSREKERSRVKESVATAFSV